MHIIGQQKRDHELADEAYVKFRKGQVCTRPQLSAVFTLFNYYHKKHFFLARLLMEEFKLTPEQIEEKVIAMIKGGATDEKETSSKKEASKEKEVSI